MYLWRFSLGGYNFEAGKYQHEGLTIGESYTEAVEGLEKWYGDDIVNLYIEPATDEYEPYLLNSKYENE